MPIQRPFLIWFFVCSVMAEAATPSFFEVWRGETTARLAQLLPKGAYARRGRSGVSITDLASVLKIGVPQASLLLSTPNRHLTFRHAELLAARFAVKAEFILAFDMFDHFADLGSFEAVIAPEAPKIKEALRELYLRHSAELGAEPEHVSSSVNFVFRWRAEVKRRLAGVMPGPRNKGDRPSVNIRIMARVIGRSEAVALTVVSGRQYLTYDYALAIAREFGHTADFYQAGDMLHEFATALELERALSHEKRSLRNEMRRLYAAREKTCRNPLIASAVASGTDLAE